MTMPYAAIDRPSVRRAARVALCAAALAAAAAAAQPGREIPSLAPVIEAVSPAVVNISVSGTLSASASPLAQDEFFRRFFQVPPDMPVQSAGSGVIVDAERGYILTNHHVVENADRISVTLLDKRTMDARVVGSDPQSDLAVLEVTSAGKLEQMPLGDSAELRVGDYVVAIGNPFGFAHTVTSGIVSGLSRSGINDVPDAYEDFIQTDASINPGNSGGALVNLRGELVGINSVIVSRGGGNIGIGFAIPVNMARSILAQLVEYGHVSRGLLGVGINNLTPETAALFGLDNTAGALVSSVSPDSAAERAGIEIEDIIVRVDDQRIGDPGSLRNAIGLLRPGTQVRIGLVRDGRDLTVTAVLGEAPTSAPTASAPAVEAPRELDPVFNGAELVESPARSGTAGVLVARVESGSAAWDRGLRSGDIITHVNRVRVRDLEQATELIENARSIVLQLQRGNRSQLLLMR